MANILHLETTTLNCGVAIFSGSEVIASKSIREEGYSHAENIMPFIEEVLTSSGLSKSDLDAVSVSGGPGSYTGLRIGVATAKGICHALSLPFIAVDTLSILKIDGMKRCPGKDAYVSMLDARRMEVYTRTFTQSSSTPIAALVVDETSQARYSDLGSICFIGDGALKCKPLLQSPDSDFIDSYPTPESALELAIKAYNEGDFVDLASYEPMYLKAFKAGVAKDPFNLRDKTNRFAQ